ncbi:unnamed protein product [Spirodela intermedia]|uniref:C2 domain-containing protein n=1 Tax=Spirodela intermedia TaxID=51605 RepID=A0A7I8J9U2_SPIIN|nr:unnamed protein product [Spirodela intermedia]CAA6666213.1 unnamed protein product [Spirodela intermedia]
MTSPQHTVRKLTVEVVDARDLLPKDGQGTSSPYVVVEFAGQRKRTKTSKLEFLVPDPADMEAEELDVEVYSDKRQGTSGGGGRKNHFLGRKGEEGLIYFPLEKRALLSWVRGDIGLRIYYYEEQQQGEEKKLDQSNPQQEHNEAKKESISDIPLPTETASETQEPPPVPLVVVEEVPSPDPAPPPQHVVEEHPREVLMAEVKKMQTTATMEKTTVSRRTNGGHFEPKAIPGKFSSTREAADRISSAYDLVEPMQFLFVKVVKARNLQPCENPSVKVRAGAQTVRTKQSPGNSANPEWNQVFSFSHTKAESTLEISVWDGGAAAGETFLGGVCFDLSDVPVRDKPDGPLAAQWYRLEGSDDRNPTAHITGDIMVSVWIGTQADEAFPDSWNTEAPTSATPAPRSTTQDLHVGGPSPSPFPVDVRVKIQLGFQSSRTRRSTAGGDSPSFSWHEDLMFVVSEPLDDQLLVLVEDRSGKETTLLGHAMVEVASVEQRLDERPLSSKWFNLDGGKAAAASGGAAYAGRIHLRLCLEGGYHVLDEAAHVCSDFRATAKQLWRPAVGTKGGGKGSTDAYCVAKYGKKWVRTRTITDSFDPRWNEQYTWQVYDPCTVLTIGVFDNWRMFADLAGERPDYRIGKVRIRLSTLESNRVYTNSYPLLVLLRSGLKKMGEVEVAVRFACPALLPDTCAIYAQPMLPRMHHLRPIGVPQQEALRGAAIKMVAGWLARSEPPLGPEVVRYMLDADSHIWSMRRSKSNWFRIMAVLAWIVGVARWLDDIRRWRNPVTTFLVHLLFLVLVWYPELAAPTGFFYLVLVAAWYRRFRPKLPPGMDVRLSQADAVEPDELDEEFDAVPTGKPEELVRARYDRLRTLAGRVQTVMGDFAAQGERLQALVSWRDPRATRLFVGACSAAGVVLYVVPPKMVAVALGFYFLRHPMFRDPMPPPTLNFFRRLPSLSDRIL